MTRQQAEKTVEDVVGPAKISAMHRRDRELSVVAGAPKGFRRIDRLQWLFDHKAIEQYQLDAGRRLQEDWHASRLEVSPGMQMGRSGSAASTNLSDAKCDAIQRLKSAMGCLPIQLETLLTLFLMPEDEPFSLERCAAIVREDRKAASYGIRIGLTILARHYGYST